MSWGRGDRKVVREFLRVRRRRGDSEGTASEMSIGMAGVLCQHLADDAGTKVSNACANSPPHVRGVQQKYIPKRGYIFLLYTSIQNKRTFMAVETYAGRSSAG